MTDLILHIGLPKCASTTMQKHILGVKPGYLGKGKDAYCRGRYAKELRGSLGLDDQEMERSVRVWCDRVQQLVEKEMSSFEYLIASDEGLSRRKTTNFLNSHPIGGLYCGEEAENRPVLSLLDKLRASWVIGDVKVIIVFRNQPEWLASLYSQHSQRIRNASQAHFECQVKSLIDRGDDFIDWSLWLEGVASCVGRHNVCPLFSEEAGEGRFLADIESFLGEKNLGSAALLDSGTPREKISRSGKGVGSKALSSWR